MPIYDYRCQDCQKVMEIFHRSKVVPPEVCVHCGAKEPRRILSSVASFTKSDSSCVTPTGQCGMETGHCNAGG